MTRDEIIALFTRREAAWRVHDGALLTMELPAVFVDRLDANGLFAPERRVLDFTGVLVQVGGLRAKPSAGL